MRRPKILTSIPLLLLGFASTVLCNGNAVALSSFTPAVDASKLSPACKAVYTSSINGCTVADFKPPNDCSSVCIGGLIMLDLAVTIDCIADTVDPGSILGYFQRGLGIQALCNIAVITATAGATPAATGGSVAQSGVGGPKSTIFISPAPTPASSAVSIIVSSPMSSQTLLSSMRTTTTAAQATTTAVSSKSTMKSSTTIKSPTATPTAQQANTNTNPSKPNCNGTQSQSNSGSPFDSFNDQLCSGSWTLRGNVGWTILGTISLSVGMMLT